jgi:hypothetical protein
MSGLPPDRFPPVRRAERLGPYPIWPCRPRTTNSRLMPPAIDKA